MDTITFPICQVPEQTDHKDLCVHLFTDWVLGRDLNLRHGIFTGKTEELGNVIIKRESRPGSECLQPPNLGGKGGRTRSSRPALVT